MNRNFRAYLSLTKRGVGLFLKDKAGVFFSLLAPIIILLLYVLFLADVQLESLQESLNGLAISDKLASSFVDGWMLAGVISVVCITVPFSAQSIMIKDKETGSLSDIMVAPVGRRVIEFSYLTSVFIVSTCICLIVLAIAFVYMAISGWYLSVGDVFAILGMVILSLLSASLISNIICTFISTQGAHGAFTGILSAAIGFLVGAYMPLSLFPKGVQYVVLFVPGTYSAGAFRNFFMRGALEEIVKISEFAEEDLVKGFSMELDFFGKSIDLASQVWIFVAATIAIFAIVIVVKLICSEKNINLQTLRKSKKTSK